MNQYSQIVNLKSKGISNSERGYRFESLIREIQPWDSRPPIVMSPKSEQLDGVFEYQSKYFIIESKAVKKTITPGCKEWEDYELKLQRRKGNVFGLFCCLYSVSNELIERGNSLNQQGFYNIILHGSIWDKLNADGFDFSNLLDYMILNARIKFISSLDDLVLAKKWYYDNELIGGHFNDLCKKNSSIFMRRFIHKFHEKIYVTRNIDKQIESHVNLLRPSVLKRSKNDNISQIIVLRDLSGSGKTTLSIENIKNNEYSFCFGTTASNTEIDLFLDNLLNDIKYRKFGIKELTAIDKPLLLIIDSLDEVPLQNHPQKRREIKSLFSKINELNNIVTKEKFSRFPLVVLFTVREDYWRDWDASFDGREVIYFKNRISYYLDDEFKTALKNYSKAYNYEIENKLNEDSKGILSVPVNLEIFSEVNEYNGDILIIEVWEGKMLEEFFKKKYDNIITRHRINNFTEEFFINFLSLLANNIISNRNLFFKKADVFRIISTSFPQHILNSNEVLKVIVSEQIVIEDNLIKESYKFKYTKFIEYLVSLFIIEKINSENNLSELDKFIQIVFDSQVIDIHTVLKNIKNICMVRYTELEEEITNYYQTSQVYLNSYLPKLRSEIGHGKETSKEDIKHLISNTYSENPLICWDMFFIISAKQNKQSKSNILSSFNVTWNANSPEKFRQRRWYLISKLSNLGFLVDEKILNVLFIDSDSRDWEVYLGHILESRLQEDFFELWYQISGESMLNKIIKDRNEWLYVEKLLDIIVNRKKFVLGDILSETEVDDEYVTFDRKPIMIKDELRSKIDSYIVSLNLLFNNNNSHPDYLLKNELSEKEIEFVNEQFIDKIVHKYSRNFNSFLHYLIKNTERHSAFINNLMHNKILKFEIENVVEEDKTLLMEISESKSNLYLNGLLTFIFENGYEKNSKDDLYFCTEQMDKSENFYIAKSFQAVSNKSLIHKIPQIEKIILTLESIMNKRVIGYKFAKLIQVANNAVEHYPDYVDLIVKAMQIYNVYDELISIPSFANKMAKIKKVEQNHNFDDILKLIFPKLF